MKLDELYRDVYSGVKVMAPDESVRPTDIIMAINQAVRVNRNNYIREGMGHYFGFTETITDLTEDSEYDYLLSGQLSKTITSEAPSGVAILTSNASITENEIEDTLQTFEEGDLAFKGNILYEAVRDISSENTFESTFDSDNLLMYKKDNGIKYFTGDVLYNVEDDKYYKVTSDFTAIDGDENITEVVWRKLGNKRIPVSHYSFDLLQNIVLHDYERQAISIVKNTVYTNKNVTSITLSYIPEWEHVKDKEEEVDIPNSMIPAVLTTAKQIILRKLGMGTNE